MRQTEFIDNDTNELRIVSDCAQLRSRLSPYNKNESHNSRPQYKVTVGFSYYSDIAHMSIIGPDEIVVRDFVLRVTKDRVILYIEDDANGTQEIYSENTADISGELRKLRHMKGGTI